MKRILITGATGNIGIEIIRYLSKNESKNTIIAGVRNVDKAKKYFSNLPGLNYVNFDFENPDTFEKALDNLDTIFILRPPHITNIEKYFRPLISKIKDKKIAETVFLSVQGAEKSKVIPHHKIENLITEYQINYIFLRPSYFMQNLTTTLLSDIRNKRKIILPAGKAQFNWIDVKNIGEAGAILITEFEKYKNQAIELTGYENENFGHVAAIINNFVSQPIKYQSVNPIQFYLIKKKEGINKGLILVMLLLHFLPRFQKAPNISKFYEELTGKKPTTLSEFVEREKDKFEN